MPSHERGRRALGYRSALWAFFRVSQSPRWWLSGWSRMPVDPNHMCGEHRIAWREARWFPRWCKHCRYVRDGLSEVCWQSDHHACMLPPCTCDCHGR